MAARAIWKGSLELGRNSVPVKLYAAVEDRTVHFHLLEKRTHARVKQHMVNPQTAKEVPANEIQKGYEVEPDTFVLIDEKDLEQVQPTASDAIEVAHFVPEGQIGYQYYDRPYFLGPDGDGKSYFALVQALVEKKREGLARWVMRRKEYIGALRSLDGYLLLITLRHAEEVLSVRDIGGTTGKQPSARELQMAEQLVALLEGTFHAEEYADDYRERVLKHIEAKSKGQKPKLKSISKPGPEPKSLLDALSASLKAANSSRKEKAVA